jgi:hypothetical protein
MERSAISLEMSAAVAKNNSFYPNRKDRYVIGMVFFLYQLHLSLK